MSGSIDDVYIQIVIWNIYNKKINISPHPPHLLLHSVLLGLNAAKPKVCFGYSLFLKAVAGDPGVNDVIIRP